MSSKDASVRLVIAALSYANAAAAPLVTYQSPCECLDNHGKQRWAEKNDPAQPPSDASAIPAVKPSDILNWQGPTEYLVPSSARIWSEEKWYALTGRVVDLRAEENGDLRSVWNSLQEKPIHLRWNALSSTRWLVMARTHRAGIYNARPIAAATARRRGTSSAKISGVSA